MKFLWDFIIGVDVFKMVIITVIGLIGIVLYRQAVEISIENSARQLEESTAR